MASGHPFISFLHLVAYHGLRRVSHRTPNKLNKTSQTMKVNTHTDGNLRSAVDTHGTSLCPEEREKPQTNELGVIEQGGSGTNHWFETLSVLFVVIHPRATPEMTSESFMVTCWWMRPSLNWMPPQRTSNLLKSLWHWHWISTISRAAELQTDCKIIETLTLHQ